MAEWYDTDDDENETSEEFNPRETNPKNLRAQLKKVLADNAELKTKNSELQVNLRKSSIGSYFRDKGINPKLARYVPVDLDPTEENLAKWIEDDGELFNIKPAEKPADGTTPPPEGDGTQKPAETVSEGSTASFEQAWNQINGTTSTALPPGKEGDLMSQIASANDLESLQKLIFSHGGGGF